MAHCNQATKRARQATVRQDSNLAVKRTIKTKIKKVLTAITSNNAEEAQAGLREATRLLDRAAQKGILHPNNSKRRISRLALKVGQLAAAGKK